MPIVTGEYGDYLFYIQKQHLQNLQIVSVDTCYSCYNTTLMVCTKETMKRCKACGAESDIASTDYQLKTASDLISICQKNKRFPRKVSTNIYKRCNHFKYWLKRIQGKEKNKITKDDLYKIKVEVDRQEIQVDDLCYEDIRGILKKLQLQKFYINAFSILRYMSGEPLLTLSTHQEKILLDMFVDIQESFQENTLGRVNMLSYTYIMIKFCELLGWEEMSLLVPCLKTRSKLYKQDQVWKEICIKMKWSFFPSVL